MQLINEPPQFLRATPQNPRNNMIIDKYTSTANFSKSLIIQIAISISSMSSKEYPKPFSNSKPKNELIEIEQQKIEKTDSLSLFDQLLYNNYHPPNRSPHFFIQNSEAIVTKHPFQKRKRDPKPKQTQIVFNQPTKNQEDSNDKLKEEFNSEDSLNNHSQIWCQTKLFPYQFRQSQFYFKFDCVSCQHKKTKKIKKYTMIPYWSIQDLL